MWRTVTVLPFLFSSAMASCLPISEARRNVGDSACVTGKVIKISVSQRSGTHFLNFCEEHNDCPFSVVVFARDLANVGDVRWLEGKQIQIYGKIKEFKGQPEIVLSDLQQLKGEAAKLPLLPKHYDVENRGKYSPGKYNAAKLNRKPSRRPSKRGGSDAAGEASPDPPDSQ